MVKWVVGQHPSRIVDAGCGSGRFSAAALRESKDAPLIAIDLDPLATIMTRAVLAVVAPGSDVQVIQGDFTRMRLKAHPGKTAFIGNPPYLRHHQIPQSTKSWARAAAASLGLNISGLAGLHSLFFLATAVLSKDGDVGCYVTSSEWLDVNYGAVMRNLLIGELGGEHIHVLAPEVEAFPGTQSTATISTFKVGRKVSAIGFREVKTMDDIAPLAMPSNPVTLDRLRETNRWSTFVRTRTLVPEGHIELGELVRVHRGAVTGANSVWVTSDDAGLPARALQPSVTRARELFAAGGELSDSTGLRRVIDLPADLESNFDADELRTIETFLRKARKLDVHKGYVARNRKSWWSVGLRDPAPVLATYMARRPPAFVVNTVAARHINIAHGLYPRQAMSARTIRALAAVLSRSVTLRQGRVYSGGLTKFEPREMERLPVPDLATLEHYDLDSARLDSE